MHVALAKVVTSVSLCAISNHQNIIQAGNSLNKIHYVCTITEDYSDIETLPWCRCINITIYSSNHVHQKNVSTL